jgi:glycine betaine/proline transport system substrate-binding protein
MPSLLEVSMLTNRSRSMLFTTLLLTFGLLLTACGPQPPAAAPTEPARPTIKLAENPWTGSAVNAHVARILLEEQLGYAVELITIDENIQWTALANGDLSATLEIWPSGHAENVQQYITEQQLVEDLGPLGVIGKISWYTPDYVVAEHPALASYEGFQDPTLAALFSTAETGDAGQFLAGDPSWVQYDEDIIRNLGLNLQVVQSGSEQAVLAALDAAYSRNDPLLFYFWTPHSVHARYDLTPIALPAYSDDCYAQAESGGVACDYPEDVLFKAAWVGLREQAPEAHALLSKMSYSNEDQIAMIAATEIDGLEPEEAARQWVEANESVWRTWLP